MNVLDAAQWIVNNAGLSYQQMLNITGQQIRDNFPGQQMTGTYANNIAKVVRRYGESRQAVSRLQGLKDQLTGGGRTWLTDNFPDHEWENGKREGKPFIILWPEGAPPSGGPI
jgi:hypothetical protein